MVKTAAKATFHNTFFPCSGGILKQNFKAPCSGKVTVMDNYALQNCICMESRNPGSTLIHDLFLSVTGVESMTYPTVILGAFIRSNRPHDLDRVSQKAGIYALLLVTVCEE